MIMASAAKSKTRKAKPARKPKPSRVKGREHRDIRTQARRQSLAIAASAHAREDQADE
jgi:hypothetical protein